jgi:hypothetical protein
MVHAAQDVARESDRTGQVVLYAGPYVAGWEDLTTQPGFDESLWFRMDARDEENCQNFEVASVLGNRGYNTMAYCETRCPLKDMCKQSGYLRQLEDVKEKPITYARHQHLMQSDFLVPYQVYFIDENPTKVLEQHIQVRSSDLEPSMDTWKEYLIPREAAAFEQLLEMLKTLMVKTPASDIGLVGREFFEALSKMGDLDAIMKNLTAVSAEMFQPHNPVFDEYTVHQLPSRKTPSLLHWLIKEYPMYITGEPYNSRIALLSGRIELYDLDHLKVTKKKPIIVADGTPMAELYEAAFDRDVEVYQPEVYQDGTKTTVLTGSDYTITGFRKKARYLKTNEELEPVPDEELETDETDFQSQEVRDIYTLLKYLEVDHNRVLFVTNKERRELIEGQIQKHEGLNVDFDHYGRVRGFNTYKDHSCVVVWGVYREPEDVTYRRIQAWSSLMQREYTPYRPTYKVQPYHGLKRWEGYAYRTFEDPFSDKFVGLVEVGEVRQSIDRIRPHTSEEPKTVYVVMGRPVAPWVTSLRFSNNFFKKITGVLEDEIMGGISDYFWKRDEIPSYESLSETYRRSNRDVKNTLNLWQETVENKESHESLQERLTDCDETIIMNMTYDELCEKYDLTWKHVKALKERINEQSTPA